MTGFVQKRPLFIILNGFVLKWEFILGTPVLLSKIILFRNPNYLFGTPALLSERQRRQLVVRERDPIVASSFLHPVQLPQMTGGTLGGASAQIQI